MLAAIAVAGATGTIGLNTVALTLSFAIGAGACRCCSSRWPGSGWPSGVAAFRRRQRRDPHRAGVVDDPLAVALVFNLPAAMQRAMPDYTGALQNQVGGEEQLRELNLGGIVNDQNGELSQLLPTAHPSCRAAGPRPDIKGIYGVAEHPRWCADRPVGAARQGRAHRLLGILLHQLPARDPPRRRLVRRVPRRRVSR